MSSEIVTKRVFILIEENTQNRRIDIELRKPALYTTELSYGSSLNWQEGHQQA